MDKAHYLEKMKSKMQAVRLFTRFYMLSVRFKLHVMSSLETVAYIQEHQCSVARFGDGELNMILTDKSIGFQRYNGDLAARLREVLVSNNPNLLVCIPHTLDRFAGETDLAKSFWSRFVVYNKPSVYQILKQAGKEKYIFGDTQMTRPYMDYTTDKNAKAIYPELMKLWDNRDILIVEGSATRMGLGNELFSNVKSIKRIICPAENAYFSYAEILATVKEMHNGELILIALGPAATILADDLANSGIWAIDVGHLDVEYEWYRHGAKSKCAIQGKYVNEVVGGSVVADTEDQVYLSQIVARIIPKGE